MISLNKYPKDVILFLLCSIILLPLVLLDINGALRIALGIPFIIFIPGYLFIFALFPTRIFNIGIGKTERIILSFGFSIAITSLISFGLNYTPIGINTKSVFLSIFIFIFIFGIIAIYRWLNTIPEERFTYSFIPIFKKSEKPFDRLLTMVLIMLIILACVSFIYVISNPRTGEKFTEFYILGLDYSAEEYPLDLGIGENTSVIVGIVNREQQTVEYTVEMWLVNETTMYNDNTNENETTYHDMWFKDKTTVTLDHTDVDKKGNWNSQWEHNFTFNVTKNGEKFKLMFLLYKMPTDDYTTEENYKDIAEEKIDSAYREVHLWVDLNE